MFELADIPADSLRAIYPYSQEIVLPPPTHIPYFFTYNSPGALKQIFNLPYHYFLEMGGQRSLDISLASILHEKPDFALCLTTPTAYKAPLAHVITALLNERFALKDQKLINIETCLHEAIINAVIHGNLGIDSDFSSLEGFDAYHSLVQFRLTREPYKFRRLSIAAWNLQSCLKLAVIDQGGGIKPPKGPPNNDLPYGRGLMLINSLSDKIRIGEDSRSIHMTFNYG